MRFTQIVGTQRSLKGRINKPHLFRKATLPPPNPLIQKRSVETEITYSIYPHRLLYEDISLEYNALQPWNPELVIDNENIAGKRNSMSTNVPNSGLSEFKPSIVQIDPANPRMHLSAPYYWKIKSDSEETMVNQYFF